METRLKSLPVNITKVSFCGAVSPWCIRFLHGARILSPDLPVLAKEIHHARFEGFDIPGPARVGIRIADSDLLVSDVRVSGMQVSGIEIIGSGDSVIQASVFADNPGAGVSVRGDAHPQPRP